MLLQRRPALVPPLLAGALSALTGAVPAVGAPAASTSAPPPPVASRYEVKTAASGLAHPWGLDFLPGGRILVTEKQGRLRIVTPEGKISPPIPGVPGVDPRGQGGLLDVRLAPDFAQSSLVYLTFAEPRSGKKSCTSAARGRLTFDRDGARLEGLTVIFRQEPAVESVNHFGSRLTFGRDGTLFITTGDRYIARDDAQNPKNDLGKVIRINPNGSLPQGRLQKEGWAPEVWSIGHRNIQGIAVHPATGKIWTVEHGARGGDEINIPEAGKNYGWPVITYGVDYSGEKIGEGTAKEGMEQPIYYWDPSIAVSSLEFYTGDLFPEWKGNLFVGALAGAHLSRLVLEGDKVVAEEKLLAGRGERIRAVRQGPDGALYVLTDEANGRILRLAPQGTGGSAGRRGAN